MAKESHLVGVTAVFSHDHVRAKAHGLGVFVEMMRDVVECALQPTELSINAVRGKDPLVERCQDRIMHTIPPAKVSQLPGRVSRAPLTARSRQLSCGSQARHVNFHSRRFWEHAKAEDVIDAVSCGKDEPELTGDPRDGKGNARAWAEVEHTRTVAVWGRGPKRQA